MEQHRQWIILVDALKVKVIKMQDTDFLHHHIFTAATSCPFEDIQTQLWELHDHLALSLYKSKDKAEAEEITQ